MENKKKPLITPEVEDQVDKTQEMEIELVENQGQLQQSNINPFDLLKEQLKPEHLESLEQMYDKFTSYHYRHIPNLTKLETAVSAFVFLLLGIIYGTLIEGRNIGDALTIVWIILFVAAFYLLFICTIAKALTGRANIIYLSTRAVQCGSAFLFIRILEPYLISFENWGVNSNLTTALLYCALGIYGIRMLNMVFIKTNKIQFWMKAQMLALFGFILTAYLFDDFKIELLGTSKVVVYADNGASSAEPITEINNMIKKVTVKKKK
jgi:hypothetical protein